VQNGLLLRADLHRLYDRLLLSIDPRTLRIHINERLRRDPDYRTLEGRILLSPARPGARPASIALQDHWRRFRKGAA
jgi:hypothetical protein